jgi:hypothetical protein
MQRKHPILLVFDVNGTLLDRIKRSDRLLVRNWHAQPQHIYIPPQLTMKNHYVILRPRVREFLCWVADRFHLAVWTSAEERNINPILREIIPPPMIDDDFSFRPFMEFVWYKPQCTIVGRDGYKDRVIKDLSYIWNPSARHDIPSYRKWSSRNVVLVDDSMHKAGSYKSNLLHIPTFYAARSSEDGPGMEGNQDDVLSRLQVWLESVLTADPSDIREYIRRHPFAS